MSARRLENMSLRCAVIILCAVLVFGADAGNAARLTIVNGDFENGEDPGSTYERLYAGDGGIAGWTIIGISVDYVGGFWQASSGTRWVELDGSAGENGGLQQTLVTVPGEVYTVLFDMAGLPVLGAPYVKTMRVTAAGASQDYQFSVVGKWAEEMGWITHSFSFVASGDETTIRFMSTNEPAGLGPALDNVRDASTVAAESSSWGAIKALFGAPQR